MFLFTMVASLRKLNVKEQIIYLAAKMGGGEWGGLVPTQEKKKKKTYNPRKLGNIRKVSKPYRIIPQYAVPPPKSKFCQS